VVNSLNYTYMSKKALIVIGILIVIAGGYYVFVSQEPVQPPKEFIYYKDPGLDEEQKKLSEEKLQEYITLLEELPGETADTEKSRYATAVGNAYYGLGMYKEALDFYTQASELNPESYSVWASLFLVENDMGDYNAAHEHIKLATQKTTFRSDPWIWRIDFEEEVLKKSVAEINDLYIEALIDASEHLDLHVKYAQFLEEQGRLAEAKVKWLEITGKDPENAIYARELERINSLI